MRSAQLLTSIVTTLALTSVALLGDRPLHGMIVPTVLRHSRTAADASLDCARVVIWFPLKAASLETYSTFLSSTSPRPMWAVMWFLTTSMGIDSLADEKKADSLSSGFLTIMSNEAQSLSASERFRLEQNGQDGS